MGFDLGAFNEIKNPINEHEERGTLSITGHGWREYLDLAVENGWEPKGTLLSSMYDEKIPRQNGIESYVSNDYQVMEEDDIENMVQSLEKARSGMTDEEIENLDIFISFLSKSGGVELG